MIDQKQFEYKPRKGRPIEEAFIRESEPSAPLREIKNFQDSEKSEPFIFCIHTPNVPSSIGLCYQS